MAQLPVLFPAASRNPTVVSLNRRAVHRSVVMPKGGRLAMDPEFDRLGRIPVAGIKLTDGEKDQAWAGCRPVKAQ